jgi:creatinine amidohydrolase
MGSDPYLAHPDHGARFLDCAASALVEDLREFLEEAAA